MDVGEGRVKWLFDGEATGQREPVHNAFVYNYMLAVGALTKTTLTAYLGETNRTPLDIKAYQTYAIGFSGYISFASRSSGFQLNRQDIRLPNEVIGWEPWQVFGLIKASAIMYLKYRATSCTMAVESSSYARVTARSVLTSELYKITK